MAGTTHHCQGCAPHLCACAGVTAWECAKFVLGCTEMRAKCTHNVLMCAHPKTHVRLFAPPSPSGLTTVIIFTTKTTAKQLKT
eukprot:1252865-Rhodomonas_salina.2